MLLVMTPFVPAYKNAGKRRALPWDPGIGAQDGEMDTFVRFLVKRLSIRLGGKGLNYKNDEGPGAQAKGHLFAIVHLL